MLNSVAEKPKFLVAEEPTFLEPQRHCNKRLMPSWNPQELRENTELAKEPSLVLDLNYGSDGDLEFMDIEETV